MLAILLLVLLLNVLLYIVLFVVARFTIARLVGVGGWRRNMVSVGGALIISLTSPLALNEIYRRERAELIGGDKAWNGTLDGIHSVAILTDRLEDPNWHRPGECGPRRCRSILYHHRVDSVLVASPPLVGRDLDPGMKVTRYHLDHRAWCQPVDHIDERRNGRVLDQLAVAGTGECLTEEPAVLNSADIVILDQPMSLGSAGGQRLSIHRKTADGWREIYRQTAIGEQTVRAPLLLGPVNLNFGTLLFGGASFGFLLSGHTSAPRIDLESLLAHWGLGDRDGVIPSSDDMARLAREILADSSLPRESAAMQFLGSYGWTEDHWRVDHLDIVAAIIRDQRVTDFPRPPFREPAPPELGAPILDRVLSTDLTTPSESSTVHGDRYAVEVLARAFSQLPAGAASAFRVGLLRLAVDEARRQNAAPMLARLADAGPVAVKDLEAIIGIALASGNAAMAMRQAGTVERAPAVEKWAACDASLLIAALNGLARLGGAGNPAIPVIVAVAGDKLAKEYPYDRIRWAAYGALLAVGGRDALSLVFPGTINQYTLDAVRRESELGAIGQCHQ